MSCSHTRWRIIPVCCRRKNKEVYWLERKFSFPWSSCQTIWNTLCYRGNPSFNDAWKPTYTNKKQDFDSIFSHEINHLKTSQRSMSDTVYHNFSNLVIIEALKKLVWQKSFFIWLDVYSKLRQSSRNLTVYEPVQASLFYRLCGVQNVDPLAGFGKQE